MARFAIDAHTLTRQGGGNRSYVLGLVEGLRSLSWNGEIVLYTVPPGPQARHGAGEHSQGWARQAPRNPVCESEYAVGDDESVNIVVQVLRAGGPIRRLGVELPRRLARDDVDAALFQYIGPIRSPCPVVLAIHDPSFVVAPGRLGWRLSARLWLTTVPRLRSAAAVLVPSDWTADVLRRRFPKVADRVNVVSLGVSSRFAPEPDEDDEELRGSLGLPARYLLYVGRLARRKNVGVLIDAYLAAATEKPLIAPLVLVGPAGEADAALRHKIIQAGLDRRVVLLGNVDDALLPAIYRGAELFCFPCRHEGFGLPLVEAMASGCPVIASREGALPEIVGEAGILLPPGEPSEWARAIRALCADGERRRRLRDRGLAQASTFSWQACAASTISILEAASGLANPG